VRTETAAAPATIEEFLRQHEQSDLLRFSTAGSVDDGKSTLIGRLLYDSKAVYEDHLTAVKNSRVNRAGRPIDFSLLTDGLKAEREQGITIDVAYRYFATPRRKFIIADTPGHEQYTRNMATGASTAQLAVILVDARNGMLPQSRRHTYISWLLGIPYLVVAVNKMDLVGFRQEVFESIREDFLNFASRLGGVHIHFIPISALDGDNVVKRSERTPWYGGPSLLEYLETVPLTASANFEDLRLPVQYVIRPDLNFRGYAGQLASGLLRPGDTVMALPSGRTTRVRELVSYDGNLNEAFPPMSVTVVLEDELDISRGDMLVDPSRMPHVSRRFEADLVWMHPEPMVPGKPYLFKHTTQTTGGKIEQLLYKIDVNTLDHVPSEQLALNEIGCVRIETSRPLFFDAYRCNRATGAFIVIDPLHNGTVGAGMIRESRGGRRDDGADRLIGLDVKAERVTPAERYARSGHLPAVVWLTARADLAWLLERRLFDRGCAVQALLDDAESHALPAIARILHAAGLIVICSVASEDPEDKERLAAMIPASQFFAPSPSELSPRDNEAANQILRTLELRTILPGAGLTPGEGI
jgi:sulfate adenylyltransferase large subunit